MVKTFLLVKDIKAKSGCENGIASVQKNAPDDSRYERKETKSGKHMFNLKAGNNQVHWKRVNPMNQYQLVIMELRLSRKMRLMLKLKI